MEQGRVANEVLTTAQQDFTSAFRRDLRLARQAIDLGLLADRRGGEVLCR